MTSKAANVAEYLAELPDDRRAAIEAVRRVMKKNLPTGYEEGVLYGMIGYYVPHKLYPPGYHCDRRLPLPFAGLASQKNYMSVYLACYSDEKMDKWFRQAWAKSGKKLDMGKSCIRFKKLDDLALDVIGEAIARMPVDQYIKTYEANLKRAPGAAKSSSASSSASSRLSSSRSSSSSKRRAARA